METGYISVFWFLLLSALVVPLMLGVGSLLRPKRFLRAEKGAPYECGEKSVGSAWVQFNVRFYVVSIIFIILDVELAALLPCATLFKSAVSQGLGSRVFLEIFLFVGLLLLGLVYCWVRGDLEWVKGTLSQVTAKD